MYATTALFHNFLVVQSHCVSIYTMVPQTEMGGPQTEMWLKYINLHCNVNDLGHVAGLNLISQNQNVFSIIV